MTGQPASVLVFWDYDTQWGADRSRNPTRPKDWGALEFPHTDRLLELHAEYDIPACFAVVGAAAMPGERPYHDPAQIRRMHDAGHEIASHSFRHEWLPGLGAEGLLETLRSSKDALEQCVGAPVQTFVPPFNQPFDYLQRLSISLSERRAVRRGRIDVRRLCEALGDAGYRFCRLAYRSLLERVRERVLSPDARGPERLSVIAGIQTLRLNTTVGFDEPVQRMLAASVQRGGGGYWVIYGHPHSADEGHGPQSRAAAAAMFRLLDAWRREGLIRLTQPRQIIHHASHA